LPLNGALVVISFAPIGFYMFQFVIRFIVGLIILSIVSVAIWWFCFKESSHERFAMCIHDASEMIDFKVNKKAKPLFIRFKTDKSFSRDVHLAYLDARLKEYSSARDQLYHFYLSTGAEVPSGGPMPSLEDINSMSKDEKEKLNKSMRQVITEDAYSAKDMFGELAPNCFNEL
jgi:hypothetical protein